MGATSRFRGPLISPSPAPRHRPGHRPRFAAWAAVVALLLLSGGAAAQQTLPLRIDCGDLNGYPAPEPGWTLMTQTSWPPGITLTPPALATVHVANLGDGSTPVPSDVWAIDPDEVPLRHRLTSLKLADPTVLTITGLPPSQPLRVRLLLGAAAPWAEVDGSFFQLGPPTTSHGILVEELKTLLPLAWRPVARDVRCTTGCFSDSFESVLGGLVHVWVLAHTDANGRLVLRFSSTATAQADPIYLAGFEVHRHEPLPVVYHQSGSQGPLVAQQPELANFAAAFNAADYDAAEAAAATLADPFQRGVARCWLIGWLDGSRDGRFDLLPQARSDLNAAGASHFAVPWLLSQMDDLQRALAHLDARGYEWAQACPSEGGTGFLNASCAGQVTVLGLQGHSPVAVQGHAVLRRLAGLCTPASGPTIRSDVDAWNAAPIGYGGWEPGPFLFAAAKQYGVTISMIDPLLDVKPGEPESVAFLDAFKDTFEVALTGGGFEAANFPRDMELPLFRVYAEQGAHPIEWSDATIASALTDAQIDASWWGTLVAKLPDDPSTQGWIARQRDALHAYRSVVEFWLHERMQHGELGGTLDDDIEALLQFYPLYALKHDRRDEDELAAIETLVRVVLVESGNVVGGYYSGPLSDVEHSGEYTSNTFQALHACFGYSARAVETGLGVGVHLKSAFAPATAWTGSTALGRLHFKSYTFTNAGPGPLPEKAFDIPLDGRATYPALATSDRGTLSADHPLLVDLGQWAAGWRDDALATTGGKPKGFFGPVAFPSNVFGGAGKWWSLGTSPEDTAIWGTGEASYILELLRSSYHQSTASDRWRYLVPVVRVMKAVKEWEDAGKPPGSAGSKNWVAAQFFNGPRFFPVVVTSLGDLAGDPTLTTLDDPDVGGSAPYVDGALIARMQDWAESTSLPALNLALRYALQPVLPCNGSLATAKPIGQVEFTYDKAIPYWRAAFPVLTKHVLNTDRLFLNRNGILGHMTAGYTGSGLTEGLLFRPAVRWTSTGGSLSNLAVSCNLLSYDGTAYGAFLHNPGPPPLSLELDLAEGLQPGQYLVELGAAQIKCDSFPGSSSAVIVDKPGAGARVPLTIDPGLHLVRVTRLGPSAVPGQPWDLTLDPPRLLYGAGTLAVRTRVVNAGSAVSPPGLVRLYATVLDPIGNPFLPQTTDLLVSTSVVPALGGSGGYGLAEADSVPLVLPINLIIKLMLLGLGVEFRAELTGGPAQWDPLNDELARRFYLADLAAVVHPN